MRTELQKIGSKDRHRFEGRVIKFGIASNKFSPYKNLDETILLGDVYILDENGQRDELVTDHLWFKRTLQFQRIDAQPGDIIQFDARVDDYYKRDQYADYYSKIRDYRLVRPTKIKNISRPNVKVDVPSIKEQQEAQKEKWKQERIEKEKREKVRVASDAQVGYIKAIAEYLKVDDPTEGMLFTEAKAWLNNVFSEHPKLESDKKRAKLEEKKEQTKQRNAQIYQLIKSGEKSFENIAEEYDLKLPTVKRIYKEHKEG